MSARSVVRWASLLLALSAWGVSLALILAFGDAAGINTWFILSLSVGITATLSYVVSVVMPDQAGVYALGVREGMHAAQCPLHGGPSNGTPRRLASV